MVTASLEPRGRTYTRKTKPIDMPKLLREYAEMRAAEIHATEAVRVLAKRYERSERRIWDLVRTAAERQ